MIALKLGQLPDRVPVKVAITVLTDQVLTREGLTRPEIKIKHPRDSFFSKGERAAVIRATEVSRDEGEDSLYAGRRAMKLSFCLPRGCYATILVKRITAAAGMEAIEPPLDGDGEPPE